MAKPLNDRNAGLASRNAESAPKGAPLPDPDAQSLPAVLPRDVVRALQWLGTQRDTTVELAQLASVAGVPPRTLQAHFTRYLGITPMGWLRRSRLSHARRQLLDASDASSVTDIALANGFSQLGRFSVQYREAFGEMPSETRQRAMAEKHKEAPAINDEARLLTWRALHRAFGVAPQDCADALELIAEAQDLAPDYGLAKAIEAWCIGQQFAHNFTDVSDGRARTAALADAARSLSPQDPLTLNLSSSALTLAHRLGDASALIDQAIAMDPASAMSWLRRGWVSAYLGNSDAAINELNYALHLMPFEPILHTAMIGIGCAHFDAGRFDRAARWTREGVTTHPGSFWADRVTVAAAAQCGARDEARRSAKALLRKDPDLTVDVALRSWPFRRQFMERLAEGLTLAGVPRS